MTGYRILFTLAALYNVAFGLWAGFWPLSFFHLFDLDPPRYPSIWAAVGMVIGVYAVAYAYVARYPERGTLIIAVGLLGKMLGPTGWLLAVHHGKLSPGTFPLLLCSDLIWWFPFVAYLLRGLPTRRRWMAWASVIVHVVACLALLAVSGGTEMQADLSARQRWISTNPGPWASCWLVWAAASMSLAAFVFVWARELIKRTGTHRAAALGFAIVLAGIPFDLAGETVNLVCAPAPGVTTKAFQEATGFYVILSPGVANGLYCLGGALLSILSWRTGWLRGTAGVAGFMMWAIGFALTASAFLRYEPGLIVTGALLMLLFIPWAAFVGWKLDATCP